jgi:polyisoprenyl-teichoic acid--peptidoglycan teichoic acid transferase
MKKRSKILGIIIVLITVMVCGGIYVYNYLLRFNGLSQAGEGEINTKAVRKNEPVNLLLMGVDIGDPKSKNANDPKRTDTLMLVNYNPSTEEINMVSIPRDTLIIINGKNQKINAAHAIGGINYSIESVEKLLDIDVNYYGKVDYEGFRKIIDAIGGVDMKINNRMDYDDPTQNLSIHFKKGEVVHLDGKKAEEFFRWRKNNDGTGLANGDLGRIENQHEFMKNVIDKMKNPVDAAKVLPIIPEYVKTNMNPEEILKYTYIMARAQSDKLNITTLKGDTGYINNISYFIYDEKQNSELLQKLHETSGSTNTGLSLKRDELKVEVLNGTDESGLASKVRNSLEQKGYRNITIGNCNHVSATKATAYGIDRNFKDDLKMDFGVNDFTFLYQGKEKFDIIVLLGSDFNY